MLFLLFFLWFLLRLVHSKQICGDQLGVANLPLYDVCNEVELMISKESGDDGIKVAMNDIHQNDIDFKIFDEGICW